MTLNNKVEQNSFFVTKQDIAPLLNCLESLTKKIEKLEERLTGEITATPSPAILPHTQLETIEKNHQNIWKQIFKQKIQEQRGRVTEAQRTFLKHKRRTLDSCDRLFSFLEEQWKQDNLHPLEYLAISQRGVDRCDFKLLRIAGEKEVKLGVRGKMVRFYEYVTELLMNISVEDRAKFFDHDQKLIDWILEKRENWNYSRCYSLLNHTLKCNHHEYLVIFDQGDFYFIVENID